MSCLPSIGKNLTAIYATHGHGDHFFGVNTIQKNFPKARFVATSEVIAVMRKQASVPEVESYWKPRFPGQIDSTLVVADELKGGLLELEGEQLISVPLGHTDTDSTTCLQVPSIGLAVCGDALYNDVHLHLGESNAEGRKEWIAALDKIESLKPVAAVAGTKGRAHSIRQITSRLHENTFAILTGLLTIPRPRSIYITRCLRFIPNA
jgi:glyoxylase-like metal-dependent hydrolase (beta-lactamase superfamily II)